MKKLIVTLSALLIFLCTYAQSSAETEIRKLEKSQSEAFLNKDFATLEEIYAKDLVNNSPSNKVVVRDSIFIFIKLGIIDCSYYERIIEKINFIENIAVSMGYEIVKPSGTARNAGKTVKRRYTNIWMKNKKSWQLVARQSTIISVE